MKKTGVLLGSGLFGIIIGYAMGYLRIPWVASDQAFWIGVITGIAFVFLLTSWKNFRSEMSSGSDRKRSRGLLFVVGGGLFLLLMFQAQLTHRGNQLTSQQLIVRKMEALNEAARQQEHGRMISSTLEAISRRLASGSSFCEADIQDLQRLSDRCLPYYYLVEDSLSSRKLSPERAQLLVGILALHLPDSLMIPTLEAVSFAYADLTDMTLEEQNLMGIDLRKASLERANLRNSKLRGADLREASLRYAILDGVDLTKADARRADMSWASLHVSTITEGNFDGITGPQMKLNDVIATKARFQYADLSGAFIEQSDMRMIDGELTNFSEASFVQTTLQGSNLCRSRLEGALLDETILDSCSVETEEWLTDLARWNVIGHETIRNQLVIVPDTQKRYARSRLMLIRKSPLD